MKHYLFSGSESRDEIQRILIDNCEGIETRSYLKQLNEDELGDLKTEFVENNVTLKGLNDVLKQAKEVHKTSAKPLILENRELLGVLKSKHREIEGKVYRLANLDSGMMEYVNGEGDIIETRRLRPEEKQTKLFPISKNGTETD